MDKISELLILWEIPNDIIEEFKDKTLFYLFFLFGIGSVSSYFPL